VISIHTKCVGKILHKPTLAEMPTVRFKYAYAVLKQR
jgi:hypothetical protein